MQPQRSLFHAATALFSLCLVLTGCEREQKSSSPPPSSKTERSPSSKSVRPARTASSKGSRPTRSDRPDRAAVADRSRDLPELTAENALSLRDELRENPHRWRSRLGPFYRSWAALDPVAALESAAEEGSKSLGAVTLALSGWAANDPEAAADWLAAQPPGRHRSRYAHGLVQGWPEQDIQQLAAWVEAYSSKSQSGNLPVTLTARWLHTDPAAAATWLGGLETNGSTREATELLFQEWGASDPIAAGEFLTDNPQTPNWDAAAGTYAKAVTAEDPEAALLWVESIEDPALREQMGGIISYLRERPEQQGPDLPPLP